MRSSMFKAALAAFLISTPLTMAFAASPHDHGERGNVSEHGHFGGHGHFREGVILGGHGRDYVGYSTYAPNGQLDAILADLSDANARIAYDRSNGLVTPAQARVLRGEAASIRRTAVAENKDGKIPMGQYSQLMAQVENLQSQL